VSVEGENLNTNGETLNDGEVGSDAAAEQVIEAETNAESPSSDEKNWQAEAEKLAAEMAGYKDQAIRAQAEMQNIRRRSEMDIEKAHKFALEKFAKELLPVIDSLEKAIELEKESGNETGPLREGVEMTLSMFLSGIGKFSLEQVDAVGQTFDPALHEAMTMIESPGAEPNTVIAAMQSGYTLNGRLIRPAMVVVAK